MYMYVLLFYCAIDKFMFTKNNILQHMYVNMTIYKCI